MISPEQIREKSLRLFPKVLSAIIEGVSIFPLVIPSDKRPSDTSFETFRREFKSLLEQSKEKKGFGFTVEMKLMNAGAYKGQNVPESISFQSQEDFLLYLDKSAAADTCISAFKLIKMEVPELRNWCIQNPLKLIEHNEDWPDIIKVLHYFNSNPRPNKYLRTLPIQVHSKFIEEHFSIIDELLRILLPANAMNLKESRFENRYYLKTDEQRVRLLFLDQILADRYFSGCSELDFPISAVARLSLPIKRVFIMENKQAYSNIYNFLTLPQQEGTAAIFGKGFSVGALSQCSWLNSCQIFYWGDIDTHGLLILNRLRKYYPHVASFLMDRYTLETYKEYWGKGAETPQESLLYLSPEELSLFDFLKKNNIRLEQEKIRHDDVIEAVQRIISRPKKT
jgi:hypothetical protein